MKHFSFFFLFLINLFSLNSMLWAFDPACEGNRLIEDLLIVEQINTRLNDRLPVTYNHLLQGGYFNMPSARMGNEGEVGFGYSSVPPYRNYNLRFQLTDFLELSGNYRIFKGVDDPVLTPLGFGDFSDKGANVKISLFNPELSYYKLPGLAIGFEDFLGTRSFKSQYIVLTQVLLNYNAEISLGYGRERIKGFFGGFAWFPFRQSTSEYLRGLSFALEYDATPYKDKDIEPHPKGRVKKSPLNIGVKYRLWDSIDMSLSYIRGDALAFSVSAFYNFGYSKGLVPKIEDPLPYRSPINREPVGFLRPKDALVHDFIYAMQLQGFNLTEMWLSTDACCQKILRLTLINFAYRNPKDMRQRLDAILSALTPEDIDQVIVGIETDGITIQEYHYNMEYVRKYAYNQIGFYELDILTPIREASSPTPYQSTLLFYQKKSAWNIELLPKTHTLFGSSKGKFKYALGLSVTLNGFLPQDLFYTLSFGYFFASNLYDISDTDRLNPSQLINVRTDIINYYKQKSITIDQAYLQKISNWGKGFYTRSSIGHFDQAYGGVAFECLYYPVASRWAIGVEGALLKKRRSEGISFSNKIRKLENFQPTYQRFLGSQYFLSLYYDWKETGLEFKVSGGKFLANDIGIRYELSRYFPSGLRLSFWYTVTNANDIINGERYFDKGIAFSVPLDIFYTRSSRTYWGYGMSAWLRDVGAKAYTGNELYYILNDQRQ